MKGQDYEIDEENSTLKATGSPSESKTYKVIINAKDGSDYTGSATNKWTIVAPSGSFDFDALSTSASGCTASGNAASVSDSAALAYDGTKNAWTASMTIKCSITVSQGGVSGFYYNNGVSNYMDSDHVRLELETELGTKTYTGAELKSGVSGTGYSLTATENSVKWGSSYSKRNDNTTTYFEKLTYAVELTPAMIEAGKASGSISFPITVYGLAWSGMSTGLKATTYTLKVTIGDDFPLTLPESATCDLGDGTLAVCKILMNKGAEVTSTSELDTTRLAVASGIAGYRINASGTYTYTCEAIEYPITYTYTGHDDNTPVNTNATSYTVEDAITFAAASLDGYIFNGWTPASIAKGTTGAQTVEGSFSKIYARIGEKNYPSLIAALADAKAGDTITLAAALPEAETITVPVGVTLDLGGYGHADSSYVLTGSALDHDATVVSTVKLDLAKFSAKGDGVADNFFKVVETEDSGTYTYELELNHEHLWGDFKLEGNVLTAKCTNDASTCTYGDGTVSITLNAEGKVWNDDDSAVTPTLSGAEAFEQLLTDGEQHAVTVGEVTVEHPEYSENKWRVGAYTAKCTVTIDEVEYELKKEFEITRPDGGYTGGFEAQIDGYGVRFDTLGEAVGFVLENSVVMLCYDGWNADSFTASASKDITLDLNGKTLTYSKTKAAASDLTIKNDGAGTVTLVNGTIKQPVGQENKGWIVADWQNVYYGVVVSGPFAFGNDLIVTKLGDSVTVTANDSLAVVDGKYQSAFAGKTEISGGVFTVKPTLLADGYVVRTIGGDYPYEVIKHEHVMVTDIIGENTLSNYCAAGGCDLAVGQWATISVNTPATYTGKAFTGVTKTGELDATLTYFDGETQLDGVPTAAGDDYKVVMSYNDKAITNGFEITAATIDSIAFDPAEADFTGSPITTKMTVKAGSLTLGTGDYDITAGSLTATGSAAATTNIEVTVVGKGNFQGTKTGSWTIKAPGTGDATFETPTIGGDYGTLNGTTLTIDEKSVNLKETSAGSGVWTMSMTVGVPLSQNNRTYVFTPEELLFFTKNGSEPVDGTKTEALAEFGIVVSHNNTAISQGTYKNKYKAESFTWTETITVEEAVAAAAASQDKIVRTIKAYAVSYNETYSIYTLTNEGGLPETTYTMEIPLATLKLIDEYGNQRYPVLTYVAKIGNIEYTSVSNALEAAEENETVELTAADPVAGAYDLPVGVTLKIGGFGNAAATYKLCAKSVLIAAAALDAGKVTADTGLGIVGPTTSTEGVMYETKIVHVHGWTFAAEGNVLTATCTNDNCYLEKDYGCQLKITLDADGGEWTGEAFAATVDDGFVVAETPEVKGYSVGEITYSAYSRDEEWGDPTADEPSQVGKYRAQVKVTVDEAEDSPFSLVKEFEITKPATYSSGFELKETGGHYTSFDAAVSDARDGDTIVWWEGDKNQASFDFTSDKDITVDLKGATLTYDENEKITVSNAGSGAVTFVNGNFQQSRGGWPIESSSYGITIDGGNNGGSVIFGAGMKFTNRATQSYNYLTVTADNIAVIVSNGVYQAGFAESNEGNVSIVGGKFWSNDDPSSFVPDRGDKYVVRSINETVDGVSCKYEVVPHTHVFTGSADGGVLTVKCTGDDSDLCKYKDGAAITLSAANATATGEAYAGAAVDNQFAADEELAKRCPEAAALSVADVVYYTKDDQTTPITPVECGEYVATLTYGEGMASVEFKIWHAEHSYTFTADDAAGTITATCVAEGPCEEENAPYVATLTVEGKLVDGEPCEATTDVDDGFPAEVTLEYWQDQTKLNAAPSEVGSYIAKMIATTNNATAASVEKAFEISAGKVTVNGKGYDDVAEAFAELKSDGGTATVNEAIVNHNGYSFSKGATLAYDKETGILSVTGDMTVPEVKASEDFEINGTLTLNGDLYVDETPRAAKVVATNVVLGADVTVGKTDEVETEAIAVLAFEKINVGDYKLTLTTNGVVQSAEKLTIEDVFEDAPDGFKIDEKTIDGGYEYTLAKSSITITIVEGEGILDVVDENGDSVDEELELSAGTTQVTLTLEESALTVPLFKVIRGNVTNVTSKTATYDIADGDTLEFIAEEASETDPTVTDDQIKTAIIESIDDDPETHDAAVAKVDAVVGDDADLVSAREFAAYIVDKSLWSSEIAECDYVAASVKLNIYPLIGEDAEVDIVDFVMAEGNSMTFKVEIDNDGVESAAIKDMVEASSDLSDWAANKLEVDATFEPGGEDEAGKVTVTPKDAIDKAFLKIVIPKDPDVK